MGLDYIKYFYISILYQVPLSPFEMFDPEYRFHY